MRYLKFTGAVAIKIASGLIMLALITLAAAAVWLAMSPYHLVSIDQEPLTQYGTSGDAVLVTAQDGMPQVGATIGYTTAPGADITYATVHDVHDEYFGQPDIVQIAPEITNAQGQLITVSQVAHVVATDAPLVGSTVPVAGYALEHTGVFWCLVILAAALASLGIILPAKKHLNTSQPATEEFSSYEIVDRLFPGVLISEYTSVLDRTARRFEPF